jgi:hypothetical protein
MASTIAETLRGGYAPTREELQRPFVVDMVVCDLTSILRISYLRQVIYRL